MARGNLEKDQGTVPARELNQRKRKHHPQKEKMSSSKDAIGVAGKMAQSLGVCFPASVQWLIDVYSSSSGGPDSLLWGLCGPQTWRENSPSLPCRIHWKRTVPVKRSRKPVRCWKWSRRRAHGRDAQERILSWENVCLCACVHSGTCAFESVSPWFLGLKWKFIVWDFTIWKSWKGVVPKI